MCVCAQSLTSVQLFAAPWIVAQQAPMTIDFSWQEYWSKLPFPTPGDFSNSGIEPESLASPALTDVPSWKPNLSVYTCDF